VYLRTLGLVALSSTLSACGIPRFDVPYNERGPSVNEMVQQIECELVDLVKENGKANFEYAQILAGLDYVASMDLILKVTDTNELAPSFSFPTVGPAISLGAGFNVTRTRTHTITKPLRYSFVELQKLWRESGGTFGQCPTGEALNRPPDLGIRHIVAGQFSVHSTLTSVPIENKGAFGGTISFTLKRNINSAGITWEFDDFEGPGRFAKTERSGENKLIIAFARGSTEFDISGEVTEFDARNADEFLNKLEIININR